MTENKRLHEKGTGGNCICPKCETKLPHRDGERCQDRPCPQCSTKMLREGSRHHQLWVEKRGTRNV